MAVQDPSRQVGYLQQCLSSDKKPLAFFLGAGCPVSVRVAPNGTALIPDVAGLTALVEEQIKTDEECAPLMDKLLSQFIADAILAPTVEDMLTHVRALRAVAGNETARGLTSTELDSLDVGICTLIHDAVSKDLPDGPTPYHQLATWINAVRRDSPVELFTTNYDLLAEQALESRCVPYFDGFAGARRPFFDLRSMEEDALPPRWARLWKVHGSINWYQNDDGAVYRATTDDDAGDRRVIHPSYLKYQQSRRLPYLAMIDRLRAFMKCPGATLLLCGYSFRDEHLNEVILQGLESSQTTAAISLMFGTVGECPEAVALAQTRSNLSVLCRDGGVIGGQLCEWPVIEENAPDATEWIGWMPVDSANPDGPQRATLTLGDFAVLGRFLSELAGVSAEPELIAPAP
ncbi:MAG: SIR2 family protein [Actinobacteria bacterium]|nr:SIR2 family protein [Actinomycetota bacterium]MCG2808113.1 SIR2 family protein [Coriobacteriia bacterium]